MKRIVRLTESDLTRIVRRVISEQGQQTYQQGLANYFESITTHRQNDVSPKAVAFRTNTNNGSISGYFYCFRVGGDPNRPNELKTYNEVPHNQFDVVDRDGKKISLAPKLIEVLKQSCTENKLAQFLIQNKL